MKVKSILTLCLLASIFLFDSEQQCSAQISEEWVSRYNGTGNGNDNPINLVVDKSENLFVTGGSHGAGTDNDFLTIKYNSSGVVQWIQRYNGTGNSYDIATSIVLDDSGNVFVAGGSTETGTETDITIIKYNSSGDQRWIQNYNGPSDSSDVARSIAIDAFGNTYVLGDSRGTGTGSDIALIKYNASGTQQWVARYNSGLDTNDYSLEVIVDNNQNVCVAGLNSTGIQTKYITLKYNMNGVFQWVRIYDGPVGYFNTPHDFELDDANNIYITGCSPGIGTGFYDFCTIKYNTNGDQIWLRRYNYIPTGYDLGNSIAIGNSGNIYVTGYSGTSPQPNTFDYATVKYDSSGNELWVRRFNGTGNGDDKGLFVRLDSLENVYVAGKSLGSGTGVDYVTLKYDSSGHQIWTTSYNGLVNGEDFPTGLSVSRTGAVYLTGYSMGSGTGFDFATVKYSQQIGITVVSSETPESFALYQNYPNPFNPVTKINFDLPQSGRTNLIVFDILGKEVFRLIQNEFLTSGKYAVEFDGTTFGSGIYFYKLESNNFVQTKRMALIK